MKIKYFIKLYEINTLYTSIRQLKVLFYKRHYKRTETTRKNPLMSVECGDVDGEVWVCQQFRRRFFIARHCRKFLGRQWKNNRRSSVEQLVCTLTRHPGTQVRVLGHWDSKLNTRRTSQTGSLSELRRRDHRKRFVNDQRTWRRTKMSWIA